MGTIFLVLQKQTKKKNTLQKSAETVVDLKPPPAEGIGIYIEFDSFLEKELCTITTRTSPRDLKDLSTWCSHVAHMVPTCSAKSTPLLFLNTPNLTYAEQLQLLAPSVNKLT